MMTAIRVQWGLVVVTAALFSVANLVAGEPRTVLFSVACGAIWLLLETRARRRFAVIFFVAFVGVAVLGILNDQGGLGHGAVPILILGVSADLAAWDLSRFLARVTCAPQGEARAKLEKRHLCLLSVTLAVGLLVTLPALVVKIPLGFDVLVPVVLLLMLMLKRLVAQLRVVER